MPGSSASTPTSPSACGSGLDQKKPLGHGETGAEAALPIWMDIMKAWIGDAQGPPTFAPPGNIVFVAVEKGTGIPAEDGAAGRHLRGLHPGTQPGAASPA